jgi:hypothetical protein
VGQKRKAAETAEVILSIVPAQVLLVDGVDTGLGVAVVVGRV